jgi:hypothetical protein
MVWHNFHAKIPHSAPHRTQLRWSCIFHSGCEPGVGLRASGQPRASIRNPIGIGLPCIPTGFCITARGWLNRLPRVWVVLEIFNLNEVVSHVTPMTRIALVFFFGYVPVPLRIVPTHFPVPGSGSLILSNNRAHTIALPRTRFRMLVVSSVEARCWISGRYLACNSFA